MSKCGNCMKYDDCMDGSGLTWPCGAFRPKNPELSPEEIQELAIAKADGRLVVLPCKVADTVWVDKRTIYSTYFHPCDNVGNFAKCEIVSFVTTKKETYMKLRALYPSRMNRREYLRYSVGAIGKTVFLTREAAENDTGGAEDGK